MYFVFQSPVDLHCHSVCIFYSSPPKKCWSRRYDSSKVHVLNSAVSRSTIIYAFMDVVFRHPCLWAARQSGFWPTWKNAGGMHHYHTQHWRYCHTNIPHIGFYIWQQRDNIYVILVCLLFNLAMSSYLFIVKSELPLVIQAFLSKHENTGWVRKWRPGGIFVKTSF